MTDLDRQLPKPVSRPTPKDRARISRLWNKSAPDRLNPHLTFKSTIVPSREDQILIDATAEMFKIERGGSLSTGETYLVGEHGPERFVPGTGGWIIPNDAILVAHIKATAERIAAYYSRRQRLLRWLRRCAR